jgi:RNA 3'-terminal phosphate cyclase-like protein
LLLDAGTAIMLRPGVILGGTLSHECPLSRSIGYFLEPIIMIAPFAKRPFDLTIRGITTDDKDLSASIFYASCQALNLSSILR